MTFPTIMILHGLISFSFNLFMYLYNMYCTLFYRPRVIS